MAAAKAVKAVTEFSGALRRPIEKVLGGESEVVLVQDYQLALVPQMLRAERPQLRVGLFWHIPWPSPEAVRICPWRAEILRGMLGAELVGFHLPQYCNNFLSTVHRMLEARLDRDHLSVELKGRESLIRPFPISVQNWSERGVRSGEELSRQIAHLKQQHNLVEVQT